MIIQVPIVYPVQACLGRKRNPERLTVAGTAPCELREVSSADAPVVMWWARDPLRPQECIRWHEGKLYAPLHMPHGHNQGGTHGLESPPDASTALRLDPRAPDDAGDDEPDAGDDPDAEGGPASLGDGYLVSAASLAHALAGRRVEFSGCRVSTLPPERAEHDLDALPVRKVVASGLDATRARVAGQVGVLLSVDGVAFREVARPIYLLKFGTRGGSGMAAGFDDDTSPMGEHAFQPDEYAALREAWLASREDGAGNRAREVGPYEYAWGQLPPPEVVRPDLLPGDDPVAYHLSRTARAVVSYLSAPNGGGWVSYRNGATVAGYDRPVIMAFGRLRDALAAEAPAGEIAERLSVLAEACQPHGTLWSVRDAGRFAASRAEAVLRDQDALSLGAL